MKVYHYTTMEAFVNGIVINGPEINKELCFHGTHFQYLNDPTEKDLGINLAFEAINKYYEKSINHSLWGQRIENIHELKDVFCRPYIVSFSRRKDFLPMWGLYGKNGAGIALGFNMNDSIGGKLCRYFSPQTVKDIELGLEEMSKMEEYNNNLLGYINFISELSVQIKDKSYAFEQEYRLFQLSNTSIDGNPIYKKELICQEEKYKVRNGQLIPYAEFFLPKSQLKEIIIGPTHHFEEIKNVLNTFLQSKGFKNVLIIPSQVPYRTF